MNLCSTTLFYQNFPFFDINVAISLNDSKTHYLGRLDATARGASTPEASLLYCSILRLKNLGVLVSPPPHTLGQMIGQVKISYTGIAILQMIGPTAPEDSFLELLRQYDSDEPFFGWPASPKG